MTQLRSPLDSDTADAPTGIGAGTESSPKRTLPKPSARFVGRLKRLGLVYADSDSLPIERRPNGRGFIYIQANGTRLTSRKALERIRSLAIPPAYSDVRIAADPRAHIQAIGRDEAGRRQYRYHPAWEELRERQKQDRLAALCEALPRIRKAVKRHLERPGYDKTKVLAAVTRLIDLSHIRIGHEGYVHSGRVRGAATLLKRHVTVEGDEVLLSFPAKGGIRRQCGIVSAELARIVAEIGKLKGPRLFQYRDSEGGIRPVTAGEVNVYLAEIAGRPITAKDFRTLAATAEAGERLARLSRIAPAATARARKLQIAEVMRSVAELLGNTPAVARKSYVHRSVLAAYESGRIGRLKMRARTTMTAGEALVARLVCA